MTDNFVKAKLSVNPLRVAFSDLEVPIREAPVFFYNDGGRAVAGHRGKTGDCVARAIAIAAVLPYDTACALVIQAAAGERPNAAKRRGGRRSNNTTGVYIPTIRRLLASMGWEWVPTMQIGQGTKVHLKASELPKGRLIVSVSKHLTTMIDGVIHDTHDPSRDGTRCVYGYWIKKEI